jgi:hypothetical protein
MNNAQMMARVQVKYGKLPEVWVAKVISNGS